MRSEITLLIWRPWPSRSTFDHDPCDLWPWPMWPLTSKITCKVVEWDLNETWNHVFWPGDLDIWPMTLTSRVDLKVIHIHALTKFEDHMPSRSWDMNFGYVTYRQTDIQKVMHKSPPCMRKGGLKNINLPPFLVDCDLQDVDTSSVSPFDKLVQWQHDQRALIKSK